MAKKALIFLFILSLLIIPKLGFAQVVNIPFLEHSCYTKYQDKNLNISFTLESPNNPINTTAMDMQDPTVIHIAIRSFSDMCRYSESPKNCYDCIVLKKYGVNVSKTNTEDTSKDKQFSNAELILFTIGALLIILIVYSLVTKKKDLRSKKNQSKTNGRNKRGR